MVLFKIVHGLHGTPFQRGLLFFTTLEHYAVGVFIHFITHDLIFLITENKSFELETL